MTAVVTSISRIDHNGTMLMSTAATAGATIMFAELITPYIELTRSSLPEGTTSGMNDCTAGVWMPPPAERMSSTTKIVASPAHPIAKPNDNTTVTAAITMSGSMISSLRLWRSAHEPPKIETTACGTTPNRVASSIAEPVLVCNTIHHQMAYCTMLEPNSENAWPISSSATRRIHVASASSFDMAPAYAPGPSTPSDATGMVAPIYSSLQAAWARSRPRLISHQYHRMKV